MITLQQAESLIDKYATSILRNDSSCKTALCRIKDRYVRISIVYSCKSVVFTDPPTQEQIVKRYA